MQRLQRTVPREVWQRAVLEAVRDAFARERLLSDAGDHLRHVAEAALRAAERHDERGVLVPIELLHTFFTALLAHVRQLFHDLVLRGRAHLWARYVTWQSKLHGSTSRVCSRSQPACSLRVRFLNSWKNLSKFFRLNMFKINYTR